MDKLKETFLSSGGEFRKCKAGTLFYVKGNPQLDKSNFSFGQNSQYPYFTRTVFNNGIFGYVDYYDDAHLIKGNSLAVGMMGMKFFYMKHDFYAGQFTKTIYPRFEGFNELVALWFIAWLNRSSKQYLSVLVREFEKVFNDTEIIVPYINGKIAIDYMEARIRELEEARIRELETYLKVAGFENCELTEEEKYVVSKLQSGRIKFKSFFITDDKHRMDGVFNVNNSHNILQSSIVAGSGGTPYVTASEGNNSVYAYISFDKSQIEEGNAIMIGGKTMVVTYQAEDFFSNDSHNLVLYAKDNRLRKELIQLFMVASLNKSLKPLYSWGDSVSKSKIKKDRFHLPVTSNGEIDYHFMETYIRAQEKLAIQRVKDWRAKEIDTTRIIVKSDDSICNANLHLSYDKWQAEHDRPMMVAEDIVISGSLEVRLKKTKRDDLLNGKLDLMLMYAIAPIARKRTESAGKIALGIKEGNLSQEAVKAYESVRYIMFHYWKNSEAKAFRLTAPTRLVAKDNVPEGYLLRHEKDACQYLLLEYEASSVVELGECDIMKVQRKGTDRYVPFVCKVEDVK